MFLDKASKSRVLRKALSYLLMMVCESQILSITQSEHFCDHTRLCFNFHFINEAVKYVVYRCFIVSDKNYKIPLREIMFHVLCFVISYD